MKLKLERGQSLFELVVAIAMSALIITAIVAIVSNSIQGSSYSRDKTLAASHVEQAMEWLRQERDQNSKIFAENAIDLSIYCLNSLNWNKPTSCGDERIENSKFTREVYFTGSDDLRQAKVSVYWQDSKGEHEVSSSTDLVVR